LRIAESFLCKSSASVGFPVIRRQSEYTRACANCKEFKRFAVALLGTLDRLSLDIPRLFWCASVMAWTSAANE